MPGIDEPRDSPLNCDFHRNRSLRLAVSDNSSSGNDIKGKDGSRIITCPTAIYVKYGIFLFSLD